MTRIHSSALALAFTALLAGPALAASADAPVTRDQVRAELAEAVRTGNISVVESGENLNAMFPANYPQQAASTLTRAQVKAELAHAKRTGNVAYVESGAQLNELFPHNYPGQHDVASKTREQVQTELAEAPRDGIFIENEA